MNANFDKRPGKGKKWVGIILLILGMIMLVRTLGFFIPDWITSWPMILIAIGVITGSRNQFRKPGSLLLIVIGFAFLADEILPGFDLHHFFFPVILVAIGLYLLIGRRKDQHMAFYRKAENMSWDKRVEPEEAQVPPEGAAGADSASYAQYAAPSYEDYLDTVSVFGGVKKNVVSKNFKGGEIVTVMGGAEINLSQADIIGSPAVIDVTQIFGGTKIIVPPHWKVSSELAAVFGGIEDRRHLTGVAISDEKHLIIKGTSIFGGIDIRSF